MTSSASLVSISNRALLSIGARAQVSDLAEGSTESEAISVLFLPTYQALARTAPWGCLRNQASLTLLGAAAGTPENLTGSTLPLPPSPWLYQYAVPSDSLQIRYIVPSFSSASSTGTPLTSASYTTGQWIPGIIQIPFSMAYSTDSGGNPIETILCNQSQAQVVYTINQPQPSVWDSLFEAAMVASLAAYLVPALSLNMGLMDRAVKQAEDTINLARVRDGNEGTTSADHEPDWMRARATGLYVYGTQCGSGFGAYSAMIWP